MFLKNVVLREIYSKKSVTEYFWHVSVPNVNNASVIKIKMFR